MSTAARVWAVVPAAGSGRRMGAALPKQYLPLAGRSVLECALAPLLTAADIRGVCVALAPDDRRWQTLEIARDPRVRTVTGGAERCLSVVNALAALRMHVQDPARPDDWVLVHDAARPCLHGEDLRRLIEQVVATDSGGLLATPVADTLKRAADGPGPARVLATLTRDGLWRALTPQMFRLGVLEQALAAARAAGEMPTDEAQAMERLGHRPLLIAGRADNIKITQAQDLSLAEAVLQARRGATD